MFLVRQVLWETRNPKSQQILLWPSVPLRTPRTPNNLKWPQEWLKSDFWPSCKSDSKATRKVTFPWERVTFWVTFESLLQEGQKPLLSHFWGHFKLLGVRGVLRGTPGHKNTNKKHRIPHSGSAPPPPKKNGHKNGQFDFILVFFSYLHGPTRGVPTTERRVFGSKNGDFRPYHTTF